MSETQNSVTGEEYYRIHDCDSDEPENDIYTGDFNEAVREHDAMANGGKAPIIYVQTWRKDANGDDELHETPLLDWLDKPVSA